MKGSTMPRIAMVWSTICHHEAHSLLVTWLLVALALTIERLYRLRYLHRGSHRPREAVTLVRLL